MKMTKEERKPKDQQAAHGQKKDHGEKDEHARVVSVKDARPESPLVVAGFPDNGMVGSICINHMIEQAEMHQIAFVDSEYIMASALFVGKKLRHPFRIYANDAGTVCALLCEVPILARGIRSIVNALVDWCGDVGARELIVLGGIAPTNISPAFQVPRSAFVLQGTAAGGSGSSTGSDAGTVGAVEPADGKSPRLQVPTTAFVVGIGGALLSSCVANGISCKGLFVPSLGEAPDPGGAALLLDALAQLEPDARVDTESLRAEEEMIKRHLEELLKMQKRQMEEYEKAGSRPDTERIYK
ncbi:PAC2 family protein [Nitrososphaera sp.]|uniref:proteasome assembly chaperone family protein n=1 Tax=Nitrososphaera sp. TaxID=1971748 RepID=UPI00307D8968